MSTPVRPSRGPQGSDRTNSSDSRDKLGRRCTRLPRSPPPRPIVKPALPGYGFTPSWPLHYPLLASREFWPRPQRRGIFFAIAPLLMKRLINPAPVRGAEINTAEAPRRHRLERTALVVVEVGGCRGSGRGVGANSGKLCLTVLRRLAAAKRAGAGARHDEPDLHLPLPCHGGSSIPAHRLAGDPADP